MHRHRRTSLCLNSSRLLSLKQLSSLKLTNSCYRRLQSSRKQSFKSRLSHRCLSLQSNFSRNNSNSSNFLCLKTFHSQSTLTSNSNSGNNNSSSSSSCHHRSQLLNLSGLLLKNSVLTK